MQEKLPKFQDIFTNSTDIESRSNHHFPSTPHPKVVPKVLPFSPMKLSSHIIKVETSVYPAEKDPISKEFQHSSEAFKHAT